MKIYTVENLTVADLQEIMQDDSFSVMWLNHILPEVLRRLATQETVFGDQIRAVVSTWID